MNLRNRSDLTIDEIALAFELRHFGCCFKRIAEGLHIDPDVLSSELRYRANAGTGTSKQAVGPAFKTAPILLQSIHTMRQCGFGWSSISDHLFRPREQLRFAYNRALRLGVIS